MRALPGSAWIKALLAVPACFMISACSGDCPGGPPAGHEGEYSCADGEDTCQGGENMTNVRADGAFDAGAPEPVLTVAWDPGTGRGAELPPSYFAAVALASWTPPEEAALIVSVAHLGDRRLEVRFAALSTYLQTHDRLAFTLVFPDRAAHIDCTHPGTPDQYFLDVELVFDASMQLVSSSFEQRVQLGNI